MNNTKLFIAVNAILGTVTIAFEGSDPESYIGSKIFEGKDAREAYKALAKLGELCFSNMMEDI